MPEGTLKIGDGNPLAARIREALGVGQDDVVQVVTPQFERTDGIEVTVRPQSAEHLDKLKALPHEDLCRIGVGVWMRGADWTHYVFPGEWYDYIPPGYIITGICGDDEPFVPGETDDDIRFGCLAYGWIRKHATK